MKERFDVSLLESGNLIKNGVKSILSHTGRVIATITFSICSLALFTNISFAKFSLESFSCTAAIMLIASYLLYFSMEDAGEKLGEESEEWKRTVCDMRNAGLEEAHAGLKIAGRNINNLRYAEPVRNI